MKAIAYQNYGSPDALKYEEMEKPAAGVDEVLMRYLRLSGIWKKGTLEEK